MSTPEDPYREWDAAYVLGSLSPQDRREFERHLASCPECREAVGELAGMPGLLGLITPEHARMLVDDEPVLADPRGAGGDVIDLQAVAREGRRRGARRRTLLVAAAAALVVVGGAGGAVLTNALQDPGSAQVVAEGRTVNLEPVAADVNAALTLTSKGWGTQLDWSCTYPADGWGDGTATYALVLVDDAGHRTVAATWEGQGAGAKGLAAASSLQTSNISRVEISVLPDGAPGAVPGPDATLAAVDV